jgi:3-deoxy-D-manno-octulosonic-acid transferase
MNSKVRRGLRGRKTEPARLKDFLANKVHGHTLWVHAASMGEFEQAKPIIEALKKEKPDTLIIASFFSPSGYDNNLHYKSADFVTYIPLDFPSNARKFLDLIEPSYVMFIRYDIWPNHILACQERGIPVILVNATLRISSSRFNPMVRSLHRRVFNSMKAIFTVSEDDAEQFRRFGLEHPVIQVFGDSRFDRVEGKALQAKTKKLLPVRATLNKRIVVFGSSWNEDEEVFLPAVFKLLERERNMLFVIVPHEPTEEHLENLEYKLAGKASSLRFSYLTEYNDESVIIIDSIGILLPLYASADIAFVGGGFKNNVHNTLEPAAYGIPVLYGPRINNSQEARQLADAGGGFIVEGRRDFYQILLRLLDDEDFRKRSGKVAGNFVHARAGATEKIMEFLLPHF